jgi:hypothetical protein
MITIDNSGSLPIYKTSTNKPFFTKSDALAYEEALQATAKDSKDSKVIYKKIREGLGDIDRELDPVYYVIVDSSELREFMYITWACISHKRDCVLLLTTNMSTSVLDFEDFEKFELEFVEQRQLTQEEIDNAWSDARGLPRVRKALAILPDSTAMKQAKELVDAMEVFEKNVVERGNALFDALKNWVTDTGAKKLSMKEFVKMVNLSPMEAYYKGRQIALYRNRDFSPEAREKYTTFSSKSLKKMYKAAREKYMEVEVFTPSFEQFLTKK